MVTTITVSRKFVPQRTCCGAELLRGLGGELGVVLVGGDRLVLGAVVHEHALDVGDLPDEEEITEEDAEAQGALGHVEPEAVEAEDVADAVRRERGQEDEDRGEERERRRRWSSPWPCWRSAPPRGSGGWPTTPAP